MVFMTFSTNVFLLLFSLKVGFSMYLHNQISARNCVAKEPEHTFNVSV